MEISKLNFINTLESATQMEIIIWVYVCGPKMVQEFLTQLNPIGHLNVSNGEITSSF